MAFDKLIASFSTIIGKVFFNAIEVGSASQQLTKEAQQVTSGSSHQQEAAIATASAISQLTDNMNQVSQRAHETAPLSQSASDLSQQGVEVVHQAASEMEKISFSVSQSSGVVRALGERPNVISGRESARYSHAHARYCPVPGP